MNIEQIQHDAFIFSFALSRDETLLACGGTADVPITIWNLARGRIVSRLVGLKREVHALAFSPDGALLAAANLWGGLCVWDVGNGRLLEEKPETSGRRTRTLVYPETSPEARFPVMLSDSIFRPVVRNLASNGKFLAVGMGTVSIMKYRSATELARLDPSKYKLTQSGIRHLAWSGDSQQLAVSGDGWAGVWQPFAQNEPFFAVELLLSESVRAIGVLGESGQVVYALGREITLLKLPKAPLPPLLTEWQIFMRQVPPLPTDAVVAKRDWQWDVTQWGYEGVHTYEGQLVWYSHSHNPHGGGGALEQNFADFLKDGPPVGIPEPILIEVCQVVRVMASLA